MSKIIVPTREQWLKFWEKMDEIGVWDWKPNYPNPGYISGTKWEIDIGMDKKRIFSRGEANFPGYSYVKDNRLETAPFSEFLNALNELTGVTVS